MKKIWCTILLFYFFKSSENFAEILKLQKSFLVTKVILVRAKIFSIKIVKIRKRNRAAAGEEARRQLHKNAATNIEQVLAATPHKTLTVRPLASYHENYSS